MRINEIESTEHVTIKKLFRKYFITSDKLTVDSNGLVSCNDSVDLKNDIMVNNLPVKFLHVDGDFLCNNNKLISLEGSPQIVGGGFYCNNDQLTSLKGGPRSVGGIYICGQNPLVTLEGLPDHISERLYITYSPTLPLMRSLIASNIHLYGDSSELEVQIQDVLNKYAGRGKAGMMACSSELLTLGKKLGVDLRQNARW